MGKDEKKDIGYYTMFFLSQGHTLWGSIHHLLLIMRKPVSICIKHRSIKRRSMHVDRFHIELHEKRIQYRNLNIHNHTSASNCIHNEEISRQ